jgi:hypothetical protein
MKKLITLIVILVIILGVWWKYYSCVKGIKEGHQGDPVRTVHSFMNTAEKFSTLIWDEEEREAFLKLLEEWKSKAEEGEEEAAREALREYGIEDPSRLFENRKYGKAAAGILCLYQFDSFSIEKREIEEDKAVIEVEFLPQDILGIGQIMAARGVPQRETKKEPILIPFHLKKHWHRWYIVEVKGELEPAIDAAQRLR